ncbi:MAG: hypothetical protein KDB33_04035, partial [Acidimicrobiales bacterium]|nr:hypothetical protein [Acidimicrobiales bacterium]
ATVRRQIEDFGHFADADEVIVVLNHVTIDGRLRTLHLLADAYGPDRRVTGPDNIPAWTPAP